MDDRGSNGYGASLSIVQAAVNFCGADNYGDVPKPSLLGTLIIRIILVVSNWTP
jgi:hypothetical protein